jgi:hypothetical protein
MEAVTAAGTAAAVAAVRVAMLVTEIAAQAARELTEPPVYLVQVGVAYILTDKAQAELLILLKAVVAGETELLGFATVVVELCM